MCGIVGAIARRNVVPMLVDGLKRLEYRGYDSAGVAVLAGDEIRRVRRVGRVAEMENAAHAEQLDGLLGIGHTRWATHGGVTEPNAHPHVSNGLIAVVHNGIIENHEAKRAELKAAGYVFTSQTDTEVIAHLVEHHYRAGHDLYAAVKKAVRELTGAYAIGVIARDRPDELVCARMGCPLLIGLGDGENFIASDVSAVIAATRRVVFLEEGDVGLLTRDDVTITDQGGVVVERPVHVSDVSLASLELGPYSHFMQKEIHEQPKAIADTLEALVTETLNTHAPDVLLLSVPFPGSVYAAFRIAQTVRRLRPDTKLVLGGGYVNTELRSLAEPRVFDYFDYVTLDDGERPLLALLDHLAGGRSRERLVRTYLRDEQRVRYVNFPEPDVPFSETGTPTWDGLPIHDYLSLIDMLNPMHRLWSDGRWNKLTVAHGCYWKKCSFCDVSLDYISRYETANASLLADRIERIVAETGQTGFHFVDEAAPPKMLRALAEELIRRRLAITWWGNIRFEKSFDAGLCRLLAQSGCIAVSGGLEVASDRLLKLMKKGVSVEQVARVTRDFTEAGILVHAYLMYGFPTQTVQDSVDALEYVRQLFEAGCIQSGYFHRFACTIHSPVGKQPAEYGISLKPLPFAGFAQNDVGFTDPTGTDHAAMGRALSKALYNFMHGIGLDWDVRRWFDVRVPKTQVPRRFIERALTRA